MNENRENTASETEDTFNGMGADEAQAALMDGFADEGDDWPGADETGPADEDELILEAEPEDGALLLVDAAESFNLNSADDTDGMGSAGGTDGASGGSAGGAGRTDGTGGTGGADGAGKAASGADAAANGTARKDADETAQAGEEPKYKVELYGREQELTVPQLVAAAQKGLDYDNVRAQLNAAQQALPALRLVEQYAAANGMTAQQYLQAAGQNMHRQAVENLTQKGVPEQTARELVAERMRLEEERRAIAPLMQHLNAEAARKKARDPWLAVTREYPDVVNLPESVLLNVQKGETPLAAMRAWELEQLRAKLSAQEMQLSAQAATLKNRQTAPGSAAGAADTKRDPFLDALFSTD